MSKLKIRKAKREDCGQILELIKALALYEKAENEVSITLAELEADGFGENPIYDCIVAEMDRRIVGMALFYEKYSTWKGKALYLEDLIVTESKRRSGIGKALFEAVIMEAKKRNSGRMEWQVLEWNQAAIDFYKKFAASLDGEWLNGRLSKAQLDSL